MSVLHSQQRSSLEKAVVQARRIAEVGAENALKAFAVDHIEPYSHMTADQRALRNQLRSKARLLGDHTLPNGGHTITRLSYELAYEYWHRMLFAKFLEANHLLIHPGHGIAVTLEECEELAREEKHEDKWTAAAFYASNMLPAIFRPGGPLMQVKFATEDRVKLEQIIEGIENDIFTADDSLGWVYQYWQSEEKERVNASEDKIDGERLPAVTQLFTEPYMVHFLIDNTLGAWWTARNPGKAPPVEFKYLRTLEDGTPAAGSFDGWPGQLSGITMLDPCMGSGHFIVEVFKVMAALRMHDEGLSKLEASDTVIQQNIHGLELDPRCTQIAAFNLALTAWKFCGAYRTLPEMNLACCGIAPKGKKEDWLQLANAEADRAKRERLKGGLGRMYDLFQQAPELGSLIDPTGIQKDAFTSDFEELQPFLEEALINEAKENENYNRGVIAQGMTKAGLILSRKYYLVITNVPYLTRAKQTEVLMDFCDRNYGLSKNELGFVFVDKFFKSLELKGSIAVVKPQNLLYMSRYKAFRKKLFLKKTWVFVARLGSKAFEAISGEIVNVGLFIFELNTPNDDSYIHGIDVSNFNSASEKEKAIKTCKVKSVKQKDILNTPDYVFSFDLADSNDSLLETYAECYQGLRTGDTNRFIKNFWEIRRVNLLWELFQTSSDKLAGFFSGYTNVILWEKGTGTLHEFAKINREKLHDMHESGNRSWHRKGIAMGQITLRPTGYWGNKYDNPLAVITPINEKHLMPIYSFLTDESYPKLVKEKNRGLYVTNAALLKIPFDLEYWQEVAQEKYPNGLPAPYSDDPTQWLFHGHPKHTESPLQVTIARLLGYQWPAEYDKEMELAEEARDKIAEIQSLALPTDEDGIVCLPPVNGEVPAAERIREHILKIWGADYDGNTIKKLLQQEGSKNKELEAYLRDEFFQHHCKLFQNRPFIWHIWDGRKDGFSALANYHKLDKAILEKLIYTYLGDWINQCQLKLQNDVSGADGLLSAATALKEKLLLILEGEPPYDLFIRWKPLEEQPIGWDPDINDGVRLNVYPFVQAEVLRRKFNVNWGKDRGKNPSGSPWGPERWNRYEGLDDKWKLKDEKGKVIPHLTNEVKRKARIKHKVNNPK